MSGHGRVKVHYVANRNVQKWPLWKQVIITVIAETLILLLIGMVIMSKHAATGTSYIH